MPCSRAKRTISTDDDKPNLLKILVLCELTARSKRAVFTDETVDGNISVSGLPTGLYLLKHGGKTAQFIKE
jgi:hypothetical protein